MYSLAELGLNYVIEIKLLYIQLECYNLNVKYNIHSKNKHKGCKIQTKGYEKEIQHFISQNQVNKKDSNARNEGRNSYKAFRTPTAK